MVNLNPFLLVFFCTDLVRMDHKMATYCKKDKYFLLEWYGEDIDSCNSYLRLRNDIDFALSKLAFPSCVYFNLGDCCIFYNVHLSLESIYMPFSLVFVTEFNKINPYHIDVK